MPTPNTILTVPMTAQQQVAHGIDAAEFPDAKTFWLTIWPDGAEGWYIENLDGSFWACCCNADEIFTTHAEAQAWLKANLN